MYSPYFPPNLEPEDILRFIDPDSRQVLYHIGYSRLRHVAKDSKIPIEIVRMIVKELKKLGLITREYYIREDENLLCGSGYSLTHVGSRVVKLLSQGKTYDDFCTNDS